MKSEFEINPNLLYLNSANLSISPRKVNEAIWRHRREFEQNPTVGLETSWEKLWAVQVHLSQFLGADPKDLFLRANVTQVLNALILGMPLRQPAEILVGEHEYGSIVNICRFRCQKEGLKLRLLKMPASSSAFEALDDEGFVESVVSQLGEHTQMIVLSHVVAGSGYVVPLKKLSQALRSRGLTLIVDGAYAPGALPVNLSELSDVDGYGCSLYKWMLGPKGTAFGWVHPRLQAKLEPITAGWTTFDSFGPFAKFGGGSRFQEQFSLSGCQDFPPFFAIHDLLDLWEDWSPMQVQKKMASLRAELLETLRNLKEWRPLLSSTQLSATPMLTFRVPSHVQGEGSTLKDRLLSEHQLQIHTFSLRGEWFLTLSPHVYNDAAEFSLVAKIFRLL